MKKSAFIFILAIALIVSLFAGNIFGETIYKTYNKSGNVLHDLKKIKKSRKKSSKKKKEFKYSLNARLSFTYDDNVINYSDSDLDLLDSDGKPSKFAIESKDDYIIAPRFDFGISTRRFTGRNTSLDFLIRMKTYNKNNLKNYEYYRMRLTQQLIRPLDVYLQIGYIPDYYYRNQYDHNAQAYYEANFSKTFFYTGFGFKITSELKAAVDLKFDSRDFNDRFNHLDSKRTVIEMRGIDRFSYLLKSWFVFRFGYNRAEGKNDADINKKDTSYDLKGFTFGSRVYFSKLTGLPLQTAVTFSYNILYYQTSPPKKDSYRLGRKDNNYEFTIAPRWMFEMLHVELEYSYQSKSVYLPESDLIKQLEYSSNEISLNFRYIIF
ncbi:MAG: hypothetical protein GY855_00970 [candidate division Zixibacteria bacterium]|nr:hypothetical protein [candidate division Zixibacteria bacterium]